MHNAAALNKSGLKGGNAASAVDLRGLFAFACLTRAPLTANIGCSNTSWRNPRQPGRLERHPGSTKVKRLLALIFVALIAVPARFARAQLNGPPVLDMHRLYQVVGYLYNLDPDLLAAIATAESNNNPNAVSPKGAEGLMQLMPGTARHYQVNNPFDPIDNVVGAARFLTGLRAWSRLQAPYGEVDLPAMIAAYNAGPGAVEKYGGIPPYAETQAYVRKVLWLYLLGTPAPDSLKERRPAASRAPAPPRPRSTEALRRKVVNRPSNPPRRAISVYDEMAEIRRARDQA